MSSEPGAGPVHRSPFRGGPAPLPADLAEQVARALAEDIATGDVSAALVPPATQSRGRVVCREPAVLCGTAWFEETFRRLDAAVRVQWQLREGDRIAAGTVACTLAGPARALLTGERTALNFLQLLSATATATRRYVDALAGTSCRVLDTRKTLPGLRSAQKYAVRCGGGCNHRLGLHDLVLIKENHIAAAGSIGAAVATARRSSPQVAIEVETENLQQVTEALDVGAEVVMLDDFELDAMRSAVQLNRTHPNRAWLEASGSVTLERLRSIAETGVDYVSVGALTKNVAAIDLSMRFL